MGTKVQLAVCVAMWGCAKPASVGVIGPVGTDASGAMAVMQAERPVASGAPLQVTPGLDLGSPIIMGALDRAVMDEVLARRGPQLRACAAPEASGRVSVKFTVEPGGAVASTELKASELPDDVATCVRGVVQATVFPAPSSTVIALYPFDLSPTR